MIVPNMWDKSSYLSCSDSLLFVPSANSISMLCQWQSAFNHTKSQSEKVKKNVFFFYFVPQLHLTSLHQFTVPPCPPSAGGAWCLWLPDAAAASLSAVSCPPLLLHQRWLVKCLQSPNCSSLCLLVCVWCVCRLSRCEKKAPKGDDSPRTQLCLWCLKIAKKTTTLFF